MHYVGSPYLNKMQDLLTRLSDSSRDLPNANITGDKCFCLFYEQCLPTNCSIQRIDFINLVNNNEEYYN